MDRTVSDEMRGWVQQDTAHAGTSQGRSGPAASAPLNEQSKQNGLFTVSDTRKIGSGESSAFRPFQRAEGQTEQAQVAQTEPPKAIMVIPKRGRVTEVENDENTPVAQRPRNN
jgi:hypothetical protein